MPTLTVQYNPTAVSATIDAGMLHVALADGRELAAPLEWFPRLRDASPAARQNWRLIGQGEGVHWPEVDEDISILDLLGLPT